MNPISHKPRVPLFDLAAGAARELASSNPMSENNPFIQNLANKANCHHPHFISMQMNTDEAGAQKLASIMAAVIEQAYHEADPQGLPKEHAVFVPVSWKSAESGATYIGVAAGSDHPTLRQEDFPNLQLQVNQLRQQLFGKNGELPKEWDIVSAPVADGSREDVYIREFPGTEAGNRLASLVAQIAEAHGVRYQLIAPQTTQIQLVESMPDKEGHRESRKFNVLIPADDMDLLMGESLAVSGRRRS